MKQILKQVNIIAQNYYCHFVLFVSLVGTLMSLYYSNVELLEPCVLCWYQRILLYPLVVIGLVGALTKDKYAKFYILPLSLAGTFLAGYHYLIQKTDWFEQIGTCSANNPCNAIDLEYLGFITIPFLSFLAFNAISIVTAYAWYQSRRKY